MSFASYPESFDYNEEAPLKKEKKDEVLQPDPIEVAGQVNVGLLRKRTIALGFTALREAFDIIWEGSNLRRWWLGYQKKPSCERVRSREEEEEEPETRKLRFTNQKYAKHLMAWADPRTEEKYRILNRVAPQELLFCSPYFEVPKNKICSRAIFNGKVLSTYWVVPRPVNICDTASLIQRIRTISNRRGLFFVSVGDFRHWFHQIAVSSTLSRHFGVAVVVEKVKNTFLWRTLPMGWSHSPFIAQSLAWAILCGREKNQEPIFKEEGLKREALPTFIPTVNDGFLTVYYDNFIIATQSETEEAEFNRRLLCNTGPNTFNVAIKPDSYQRVREVAGTMEWEYLGMQFLRTQDAEGPTTRWGPTKRATWLEAWGENPRPGTCRMAAQWLGRCLFFQIMGLAPLSATIEGRTLTRALSLIGKKACADGWNSSFEWHQETLDTIQQLWGKATAKDLHWHEKTLPRIRCASEARLCIASDASTSYGFGYVTFRRDHSRGVIVYENEGPEREEKWKAHDERRIFLREMEAATLALMEFFEKYPREDTVILACDNTAVCFALRSGYSSLDAANEWMDLIREKLERVVIVPIVSADNPADCHSRGNYSDFKQRTANLEKALNDHIAGRRAENAPRFCRKSGDTTSLRHHDGEAEILDELDDGYLRSIINDGQD